jgi:hypothetical protein
MPLYVSPLIPSAPIAATSSAISSQSGAVCGRVPLSHGIVGRNTFTPR